MCVRLSPTHPAARIVVGLYIFLATFLIGFAIVQAISWTARLTLSAPEKLQLDAVVQEPKQFDVCHNEDGLSLLRWHDKPTDNKTLEPKIGISNDGNETIYYFEGDFFINSYPAQIDRQDQVIRPVQAIMNPGLFPRELRPHQTQVFRVPVSNYGPYSVTVHYRKGELRLSREVTAQFSGMKQLPDGCIDHAGLSY